MGAEELPPSSSRVMSIRATFTSYRWLRRSMSNSVPTEAGVKHGGVPNRLCYDPDSTLLPDCVECWDEKRVGGFPNGSHAILG